ncbi:MAG TPA: zinc-binding dehydrogenase [Conexibacter sp.]
MIGAGAATRTTTAAVLRRSGAERPYASSRPLELLELELAPPRAHELLVRVDAAGLCHSDLSVVDGSRPRPLPMALGHEATGIVEAAGDAVGDVGPGDRVVMAFLPACGTCVACQSGTPSRCVDGSAANAAGDLLGGGRRLADRTGTVAHHLGVSGFATRAVVDRRSAVVVDADIPPQIAALFGCAVLTGVGAALNTGGVRAGEAVVVIGLGGVGLAAVLGALVAGAQPVIAVDPFAAKRTLALELGATAAAPPEEAAAAVDAHCPGGVAVALEAVGSANALEQAYALTAPGGRTVSIGLPHPQAELRVSALSLVAESRTLAGSYMGGAVAQRDIPRFVALWRSGRLPVDRLLSSTRPLSEINEALDELAEGRSVRQVLLP